MPALITNYFPPVFQLLEIKIRNIIFGFLIISYIILTNISLRLTDEDIAIGAGEIFRSVLLEDRTKPTFHKYFTVRLYCDVL